MKKLLMVLVLVSGISGCTGINSSVAVSVATDTAFVMALQANPTYRVPVIAALQSVKGILATEITYDQLTVEITKLFPAQYAPIGIILQGYIETDKPVSTSMITMLDSYKAAVVVKIDRLLLLAGT